MLTSSIVSVPLILIGESSQRVEIFMIELLRGQVLSPVFMNSGIITGLVYEHMPVKPMVVQKLDEKSTLLVFTEAEDIQKIYITLWSSEMWLGHSVDIGCDVATPRLALMGDQLHQVGREEIMLVEGPNTQLPRQMQEPQ